jgi:hypothetical protein
MRWRLRSGSARRGHLGRLPFDQPWMEGGVLFLPDETLQVNGMIAKSLISGEQGYGHSPNLRRPYDCTGEPTSMKSYPSDKPAKPRIVTPDRKSD